MVHGWSVLCSSGRARVTFKYDKENDDELTVNEGDMLDILEMEPDGQEGWVKVGVVWVGREAGIENKMEGIRLKSEPAVVLEVTPDGTAIQSPDCSHC